jgi:hypothetical protein
MKKLLLLLTLLSAPAFAFAQTFHSVTLTWPAGAGGGTVTSFGVLRGTTSGGESSTPIGTVAFVSGQATYSYVDQGSATNVLTEGSTYFYEIVATGPGGTSAPSAETSVTITFSAPAVPGKPTAVVK